METRACTTKLSNTHNAQLRSRSRYAARYPQVCRRCVLRCAGLHTPRCAQMRGLAHTYTPRCAQARASRAPTAGLSGCLLRRKARSGLNLAIAIQDRGAAVPVGGGTGLCARRSLALCARGCTSSARSGMRIEVPALLVVTSSRRVPSATKKHGGRACDARTQEQLLLRARVLAAQGTPRRCAPCSTPKVRGELWAE